MFRTIHLLIAEGAFTAAWWSARLGLRILPHDHPLRHYHSFSEEKVKRIYRQAVRAEIAEHWRNKARS